MQIDRCVCFDLTFAFVLKDAREKQLTVEQVELSLGCGGGCGLCRPYLRRCLRTGETSFEHIITDADEPG
jgi:bacterioferritin-associated ferredoxin